MHDSNAMDAKELTGRVLLTFFFGGGNSNIFGIFTRILGDS